MNANLESCPGPQMWGVDHACRVTNLEEVTPLRRCLLLEESEVGFCVGSAARAILCITHTHTYINTKTQVQNSQIPYQAGSCLLHTKPYHKKRKQQVSIRILNLSWKDNAASMAELLSSVIRLEQLLRASTTATAEGA